MTETPHHAADDALRHTVHRLSLGTAAVTTILDGAHVRTGIRPPFAMDRSDDQIAQTAAANHLPAHAFENTYTPTVIRTGGQVVLCDTGFGAGGRAAHAGRLRDRLAVAGYAPGDIDVVAFTHLHPDHIGGVMEGEAIAFPNARYIMGRREHAAWTSGDGIPPQRAQNRDLVLALLPQIAGRLTLAEDGDTVVPGLTALAAFGHSVGHMMYRLDDGAAQMLVWGDVTNHYVFSLQHPDSPVAFDDDPAMAIATRRRVLDMAATEGLLVSGHHMPFPAVGYVERHAGAYRWVPVTYQHRV
ncbi:Glyoxylase, beta-lactamase superfamily II [Loktanella fryxellensis]|uniref:Glyoxylase, beta-lactamase superfamily II n=1 Tax=Loktanella fryxellensis TaxID=245187 RepID=A0A1H8C3Y0_9RHOB|nr:MBL fold metallo-hydrolase [Loktanella fryxellensis]SEM89783.1 Glyoxylase, beta-lactamase superfamily II [Loktanella fryxellensis]